MSLDVCEHKVYLKNSSKRRVSRLKEKANRAMFLLSLSYYDLASGQNSGNSNGIVPFKMSM
jgi:hypothetical protein